MADLSGLEKNQRYLGRFCGILPGMEHLPPVIFRRVFAAFDRLFGLKKLEMQHVTNHRIPVSGNGVITLRHYRPYGPVDSCLVYFHGGGCVIGSVESHDRFCRQMAHRSRMHIISVDYRLAPEYPFPVPVLDAIDAWNYVTEHKAQFGLGDGKIGVGGDSAGAYLAAITGLSDTMPERLQGVRKKPDFQLLLYPMMDLRGADASSVSFDHDLLLTRQVMAYFARHFLGETMADTSPASLVLHPDLSGSPKTWLMTVEYDPLRDGGQVYADALTKARVDIDHVHLSDCMHGFLSAAGISARAGEAAGIACDALATLNRESQTVHDAG